MLVTITETDVRFRMSFQTGRGAYGGWTGEVSEETFARWQRIEAECEALQDELAALSSQWSAEKFERGET